MYFSYEGDKMALSGQYAGVPVERSEFENHLRHVVVFLDKTLHSHRASFHPGV